MLGALGTRLQRLSICSYQAASSMSGQWTNIDGLVPIILMHCPVLTHLKVRDLQPDNAGAVWPTKPHCLDDCSKSSNVCHAVMILAVKLKAAKAVVSRPNGKPSSPHAGIGFCAADALQPTVVVLQCAGVLRPCIDDTTAHPALLSATLQP
jgi:hypothetical protein